MKQIRKDYFTDKHVLVNSNNIDFAPNRSNPSIDQNNCVICNKSKYNVIFQPDSFEKILFPESNSDLGEPKINNKDRAPTISFTIKGKSSQEVSDVLVSQGIALRNDNFYAWRCLQALGIDTKDGVIRTSIVHYNTSEEVKKLIEALEKIKK